MSEALRRTLLESELRQLVADKEAVFRREAEKDSIGGGFTRANGQVMHKADGELQSISVRIAVVVRELNQLR